MVMADLIVEEQMVLDIVHEYLDKNRYLTTDKIVPFISSRFSKSSININTNGIIQILESLVQKNHIFEGSKLSKELVLRNENRKSIYKVIKNYPGTYLSRIAKELDLKKSIAEWHLSILLKFECVKKIKINGHEAYFTDKFEHEKPELFHFMQREKYRKVIEYLQDNQKGITKTRLSKNLGMHPNTIKKYIARLEGLGIIYRDKKTKKELYFLNQDTLKSLLSVNRK